MTKILSITSQGDIHKLDLIQGKEVVESLEVAYPVFGVSKVSRQLLPVRDGSPLEWAGRVPQHVWEVTQVAFKVWNRA